MEKYLKIIIKSLISIILLTGFIFLEPVQAASWESYGEFIPDDVPIMKRHLRGAWISTVLNLDWPSADVRKIEQPAERINRSKEELTEILDKAVELGLNAVFFQVSPEGDALYKSDIVPWSRYLTGTFGRDPGFDPLEFAIEEAHRRNLEIHAWFNPYRVSMNKNASTLSSLNIEKSVYKEHPQWVKTSMNRLVVDPGIPEAREWVISRVMEVVKGYDVDGVHFDDYFYYEEYEGEIGDRETFNKYNNGRFSNIGDFRRNNTYILIKELSRQISNSKPWVKFGISPAGVWGNKKDGHPEGSNTESTLTNYDRSFADTKRWVEEELIDYIAPQVYFTFANPRAPYGEVSTWWADVCKDKNVHLYIGQAFYKINDDSDAYFKGANAIPELSRQLKFNMSMPQIDGTITFRFKNFDDLGKQQAVTAIKTELWRTKALVPLMPWKGGNTPASPSMGKLSTTSKGVKITWEDDDPNTAYYAVYRFNEGEKADISSEQSAQNLLSTVRRGESKSQEFIDYDMDNDDNVYYVVTALDRLHNEGEGLFISSHRSKHFPDVGMRHLWAIDAIDALYGRGVVKGDERGMYNPGVNIKRADFTIMVVKALGFESDFDQNFSDVAVQSYYYEAVGIAKKLGIVKGDGVGFAPDTNITREDMMVIMVNALNAAKISDKGADTKYLDTYSDSKMISAYAKEAVAILTQKGIVNGFDGRINPKGMATRAEIAVVLSNILEVAKTPL